MGRKERRMNCPYCYEYNHEEKYCPKFCSVIRQTLIDMQGWIPIEEKEPPCGHIIVTVLWEKDVDTAFDDDYEVFETDWWALNDSPMAQRIKARTIAWMPMPEPYRVERKDE